MVNPSTRSTGPTALTAFVLVMLAPAMAASDGLTASAEIKGCADPAITGNATLVEQTTTEGVEMTVKGLKDGKLSVLKKGCAGGAREACGVIRLTQQLRMLEPRPARIAASLPWDPVTSFPG